MTAEDEEYSDYDRFLDEIDADEYYEGFGIGPGEDHFQFLYRHRQDYLDAVSTAQKFFDARQNDEEVGDIDIEAWVKSDNPLVRNLACTITAQFFEKTNQGEYWVSQLLLDSDKDVRHDAAIAFQAHFNTFPNGLKLIDQLVEDEDSDIRELGFDLFAKHVAMFENPVEWFRTRIMAADKKTARRVAGIGIMGLGQLLPPDEVFSLVWEWGVPELKKGLLSTLRLWKDRISGAQSKIIAALSDDNPDVVHEALWAFGKFYYSIPNHQHILSDFIESCPDEANVRYAIYIKECAIMDYVIRHNVGTWEIQKQKFNLDY